MPPWPISSSILKSPRTEPVASTLIQTVGTGPLQSTPAVEARGNLGQTGVTMPGTKLATPHAATATELKAQIEAERAGAPFVIYRDGEGRHHLHVLDAGQSHVTLGRRGSADLPLPWDEEVSRVHAELIRTGEEWTLSDDGLSLNGTFVNGEPIHGRRRLRDGDALRIGTTVLVSRTPKDQDSKPPRPRTTCAP